MRKKQSIGSVIDFDDGGCKEDSTEIMRQCQDALQLVKNPYHGNKKAIIVDIAKELENNGVKYNTVLDLFSGSSVVSLFMKLYGKNVISNDLLTSSYSNAEAFVVNTSTILSSEQLKFLCTNENPNRNNFVKERYSDRFTENECRVLDNYRANIDSLIQSLTDDWKRKTDAEPMRYIGGACERECAVLKAVCFVTIQNYIMERCFLGGRLNKGQILASLEHRLEHQRNATIEAGTDEMKFNLKPLVVYPYPCNHDEHGPCAWYEAFNDDALATVEKVKHNGVDLCYLDPPYGGGQSDYAAMFRFLEEFIYSKPLEELDHIKNSKKFATNKDFEDHFREVLNAAKFIPTLAVSFNESSWADVAKIKGIITDYKKDVTVVNISHKYKYRAKPGKFSIEYLLIGR